MVKGPFSFDPQALEFRRRDRNTPWTETAAAVPPEEETVAVVSPAPGDLSVPEPEPEPAVLPSPAPAVGAVKPEGYVDPTPVRRRRRRKSHHGSDGAGGGKGSAWRGVMWGLILIMAVVWAMMIYSHTKNKAQRIEDEEFFIFERQDVVPQE